VGLRLPTAASLSQTSVLGITWLPDDLHPAAANLIADRQRIAQERLGLRALRADPGLLVQAVS
jgi:hypothetical protein